MGDNTAGAVDLATEHLDTVIIGAGISGINTAYRLRTSGNLSSSSSSSNDYAILEARNAIGGTWDFWKYPGIRSDSDLHTFGFAWEPWPYENPVAEADLILSYMNTCATKYGIEKKIRFRHRVLSADWSSTEQRWTVVAEDQENNKTRKRFVSRFMVLGTGYYNYHKPLDSIIPGLGNFKGKVIHAQFWPKDYDYKDQRVIVIGSGAAAITIVPAMVKEGARKVTMLQRSPSYVMSVPNGDRAPFWVRKLLPLRVVTTWERMFYRVIPFLVVLYCHAFPQHAKRYVIGLARAQLPQRLGWDPHFNPTYTPWQQRLCMAPDGDFYQALQDPDRADVVTGLIRTVTDSGIALQDNSKGIDDSSPVHLDADVIVAATGLNMNFGGFVDVRVDGDKIDWSDRFVWNGAMIEGVPNMFFMFGYTNASWTLGADDSATIMNRVRRHLRAQGAEAACPRTSKGQDLGEPLKMWQLSSSYVKATGDRFPKYSNHAPWRPKTNPIKDWWHAQYGNVTDGLHLMG